MSTFEQPPNRREIYPADLPGPGLLELRLRLRSHIQSRQSVTNGIRELGELSSGAS
jgi:hypothetical protein